MKKEAVVSVHYVKGELKSDDIINIFSKFQEKFIRLNIQLCKNSFLPCTVFPLINAGPEISVALW